MQDMVRDTDIQWADMVTDRVTTDTEATVTEDMDMEDMVVMEGMDIMGGSNETRKRKQMTKL